MGTTPPIVLFSVNKINQLEMRSLNANSWILFATKHTWTWLAWTDMDCLTCLQTSITNKIECFVRNLKKTKLWTHKLNGTHNFLGLACSSTSFLITCVFFAFLKIKIPKLAPTITSVLVFQLLLRTLFVQAVSRAKFKRNEIRMEESSSAGKYPN